MGGPRPTEVEQKHGRDEEEMRGIESFKWDLGEKRKSFSFSEHLIFGKICREIINKEGRDEAAAAEKH